MGSGRKRKCKICGNWIEDNNDSIPYKNGYCHKNCFNVAMKVVTTEKRNRVSEKISSAKSSSKPQKELKEGLTEEEFQQKKDLCNYLRELTKKDLPVKTYKLIDDYRKKYKISFKEMKDDLVYFFEIRGNVVDGDAIGIIPYCHTEAQDYYKEQKEQISSCEFQIKDLPYMYKDKEIKVVVNTKVDKPQISIEKIGGD